MAKVALLFGYGQYQSGELLLQTKARCDKASESYLGGNIDKIYITCFVKTTGVLISDKMKERLLEKGVRNSDIIVAPRGTNTAGEIDIFLTLIDQADEQVIGVSNYYHLPRILFLFLTRRVFPKVMGTWRSTTVRDLLLEPIKLLNSIFRPFSWSKTT